ALKDKVVIVTGASSGIGKALAYRYHSAGSKVVLAARRTEALESIANDLSANGGEKPLCVKTDVTKKEDCNNLIAKTLEKHGRIDILINNAGISMRALLESTEVEVIERVMQVNFYGALYCTKAALEAIIKSKGSIVNVSSIAGFRGLPGRTGYSASKFALHGLMESLRTELLKKGVHVLVAAPGFTESNIRKSALVSDGSHQGDTPLKEDKLMSAEEVADHIHRAVVKRKRTLVLTRQGKLTVFMNKFFPKFMDGAVYKHFSKEPDSPLK
ncbi:UNVERIFIED_CONTAM: hypothetical protein GTU68_029109, partial [Idotea baltica]|nr:hypothetical protein [Idotea baltica]